MLRLASLFTLIAALLAASPAVATSTLAAAPSLEIDVGGTALQTLDGTMLNCVADTATSASCGGGGMNLGALTIDSWSMFFDTDPVVSGITAVTNNTASTQQFTLIFTLPTGPIGPATLTSGSISGSVTDNNNDGATLATAVGSSFYEARIDLAPFQTLYNHPSSATAPAGGSGVVLPASFGLPGPSFPGPAVASSIGIALDFTLSAGDSASFTSNFTVVPVPEPTSGVLLGLGLLGLGLRRRSV